MSKNYHMGEIPPLETKRLLLREMQAGDAEAIFGMYGDEEVMRYRDVLPYTGLEEAQHFLEQMRSRYEQGKEMHWGITLKGEGQIVGCCGYSWHTGPRSGAIGYDLARHHWKQGIMSEAVNAVLQFGFEVRNLHRIEAKVRYGNDASIRLLKRLGFQEEGTLRDSLYLNDHFFNVRVFSLLEDEYRPGKIRL